MSRQLHVTVASPQIDSRLYPLNKKLRGLYSRFGIWERRNPLLFRKTNGRNDVFGKGYTTLRHESFRGLNSLKEKKPETDSGAPQIPELLALTVQL